MPEFSKDSKNRNNDAWVVFLDVFGFSSMVTSRDNSKLLGQLRNSYEAVFKMDFWNENIVKSFAFSDNIYLVFPINKKGDNLSILQKCIDAVSQMQNSFVVEGLPLRGGIAYGSVYFENNLLLGETVLRAYHYEQLLHIPLVLLPACEIIRTGRKEATPFLPPPKDILLKNNELIFGAYIHPEPIDNMERMAKEKYEDHRLNGPYGIARSWKDTLEEVQYHKNYLKSRAGGN